MTTALTTALLLWSWIPGLFFAAPRDDFILSFRRHAQRAVEADHLAVEIAVLDDVARQRGVLFGLAQQLRERDRGGEAFLHLLGEPEQHGGEKNAGRDGADPDAELRQFARRRKRQRDDAPLGRRIGRLSDLPV